MCQQFVRSTWQSSWRSCLRRGKGGLSCPHTRLAIMTAKHSRWSNSLPWEQRKKDYREMLLSKDLKVCGKGFRNSHIATCEGSNLGIRVSFRYFFKSQVICSCRINLKIFQEAKKERLKIFSSCYLMSYFFSICLAYAWLTVCHFNRSVAHSSPL